MSFQAPDLSEILTNEQELNGRLSALQQLLKNELDALNTPYSNTDSIQTLTDKVSNPPAWIIERSSTYASNQLGSSVSVTGSMAYTWNKFNPATYADTDYWYLQALARGSPSLAWGLFNTENITSSDKFDLMVYGRSMENYVDGAFSGVGFSYGLPVAGSPMTGFYMGITRESGTYYPAYAVFDNSNTPTITKTDYGTFDSASQKFRLHMIYEGNDFGLYWYKDKSFLWNEWIDLSSMPSGYDSADLKFGYVSYGSGLGRNSYVPRLYLSSPSTLNIL